MNDGMGCEPGLRCAYSMEDPGGSQICVPTEVCGQMTDIAG